MLAAQALPISGYILGWSMAKLFCRSTPDAKAIAVEIGIQNTGIAIFLLASVGQPPLIPFAVAMMTPLPLGIVYLLVEIKQR
jgi:predicted Na+-dependent transporter